MVQKLGGIFLLVIVLTFGTASAWAFGVPGAPTASTAGSALLDVSFWARPFPYGYTGWGPCIRYVPVETNWGLAYRKVRVCRSAH